MAVDDGSQGEVHKKGREQVRNATAAALVTAPFVGREIEMAGLRAALELAGSGRGRLLLVTGEPGIGKSRLMEEFSRDAPELGWRVLLGRCWEGGGAPAYWPWMQVVQQAGGQFEQMAPRHGEDSPAGTSGRTAPRRKATDDPEAVRFRLFGTVAEFLTGISRDQPLLVIVDDIHVADEASLLMLRFLAEAVSQERILVLASYREGERGVHELADAFGQLARVGSRISIRGLSSFDVGAYIEGVTGRAASASAVTRIRDVTAGNPFFLSEVVRALLVDGRLTEYLDDVTDPMLRIPEEVRVLIRRRVASLSREAGSTLRLAAAVGHEFDSRVLEHAGRLSVGRLMDVLAEAVGAGLIAQDPASPSRHAFAHDLVRETLYEGMPAARRLELHRTIGRVLEDMYGGDLESHLAELAHHFTKAAPIGLAKEAVDYSVRAGDRAAAALAYENAAQHYGAAVQLLPLLEHASVERRCEILLRLGDSQWRAGDTRGARSSFEECAEAAAGSGMPDALARAAVGLGLARLGLGGIVTGRFSDTTAGIRLLEQALATLPEGDSSLRAHVLARLAAELFISDQVERRTVLSDQAVEMARRLDDREALLVALHGRHSATFVPDQVDGRLANAEEMLRVATECGDDEMAFMARYAHLHGCLELCDIKGVDAELAAMINIADRIGQPFYLWVIAVLRATRTIVDGRLREAERLAREALAIGRVRESDYGIYFFEDAQLVTIRWAQGRMNEVADSVRVHGEQHPLIARWRNAFWAVETGADAAAREEVERHAGNGFADLPRNGFWIIHMCSLAEACVLLRDKERAAQIFDLLAPYADRNAIAISIMPFGPVALRLGMIAALFERWEEADAQFELAMERCRRLGARAITARVLYEHAKMLVARGAEEDLTAAAARLSDAERICRELDLPGILQRVMALAQSVPDRRSAGHDTASQALFRREGEYWEVRYSGESARLRDTKGLRYVATLLSAPGREVHVLELVRAVEARIVDSTGPHAAALAAGDLHVSGLDAGDVLIDSQAREAYRRRLTELEEDLQEARDWNDPERAARAQEEIDALTAELASAAGLGGRHRSASTAAERARVSVTKAIKGAMKRVTRECPALGAHLASSVQTGRFCSYAPPGEAPPAWYL